MHNTTQQHPSQDNSEIEGLKQAIRNLNDQINQIADLAGKLRVELDSEKGKVKTLQGDMEKAYKFLNKKFA